MIYIPSKGRWGKIQTIKLFSPELLKKTCLVVQAQEAKEYSIWKEKVGYLIVLPKEIQTIEPTRAFIWNRTKEKNIKKFFILDDDLTFCKRLPNDYKHTRYSTQEDIINMFKVLYKKLDNYAHVGISERLGNNRYSEEWKEVTRNIRCVGYNHSLISFNKLKFGQMEVMEDYDLTLQLFRLGLKNLVWYHFCQEQGHSNSGGGCSTFRTLELHNKNAKKLASFHPEFVKTVIKKTKGGWFNKEGISERLDVRIQWKKCYESSQNESK